MSRRHNCEQEVNALGTPSPDPANPVGPTITSAIDNRKGHENPLNGFIIQEGAMPQAFSQLLQCMLDLMPGSHAPEMPLLQRARQAMGVWKSRLLGPFSKSGTLGNTQVFLIMSHDGKLNLFYTNRDGLEGEITDQTREPSNSKSEK